MEDKSSSPLENKATNQEYKELKALSTQLFKPDLFSIITSKLQIFKWKSVSTLLPEFIYSILRITG